MLFVCNEMFNVLVVFVIGCDYVYLFGVRFVCWFVWFVLKCGFVRRL